MTTAVLKSCTCTVPRPRITPGHERTCVVCEFHIPKEWDSKNIIPVFDRLAMGFPTGPPPTFDSMRALCEKREFDGREHFGFAYRGRNNIAECREEIADAMNYLALAILVAREDAELADRIFNAMWKGWEFWEALSLLGIG